LVAPNHRSSGAVPHGDKKYYPANQARDLQRRAVLSVTAKF